jgi:uncharacterized FlaG/YvyC family protein
MGQLSVTALRAVALPEAQSGSASTTPVDRARTQALVAAVQVLNQSGIAGAGREVTYSTDSATKQLVIQVVDKASKEVLVQWPSDYALQMALEFQKEHPDNESLL